MGPLQFNADKAQAATEKIADREYLLWAQIFVNNILGRLGNNRREAIKEAVDAFTRRLQQQLGYISQDQLHKELMRRKNLIVPVDILLWLIVAVMSLVSINLFSLALALNFSFRAIGGWATMDGFELDHKNPRKSLNWIRLVFAGLSIWLAITNNFNATGQAILIGLAVSLVVVIICCWIIPASLQRAWLKRVHRAQNLYLPFVNGILPDVLKAAYGDQATRLIEELKFTSI